MKNNIITIINYKGGAGKTTTALGLASAFVKMKKKVLIIDTDPQGNASRRIGFEPKNRNEKCLAKALLNMIDGNKDFNTADFICSADGVDVLIGDNELTSARREIEDAFMKMNFLYKKIVNDIKAMNKYDYIIFDTAPSLGSENTQVLIASKYILIPTTTGRDSIEGLDQAIDFYNNCKQANEALELLGILFGNVNLQTTIAKNVIPMLEETYGDYVFKTVIPRSVIVENSEWEEGIKIANDDKISQAFRSLAKEVEKRIGKQKN